jgi:alpha-2-macroglobulin
VLPATLALAVALALAALMVPGSAKTTMQQASPSPKPQAVAAEGWKDVERLIGEQKMEEARRLVATLRESARAAGHDDEWAKALITEVQLRTSLHGYETSVRFLKEEPWPKGARARTALNLFLGRSLVTYVHAYSWEIAHREQIATKGVLDLKSWTKDQIVTEATRAYAEVWEGRAGLGEEPVAALGEYLLPNNYPPRIRGTLRDAVSYLFVELLADTSLWRADHAAEVYRLDLGALLRGAAKTPLDDPSIHPLVRICAILDDLESWHAEAGRREAALEAGLERLRRLDASFADPSDRAKIRADLESQLSPLRGVEWWSMGQAELAEMVKAAAEPDSLVRAHALAEEGRRAYPHSLGGERCLSIEKTIEAPDYSLAAMAADSPRRRSIEVTHRNLAKLYFRAYALDIFKTIEGARDYNLLPESEEMRKMVHGRAADQAWSVDLPQTSDYRSHRTFVTPPLEKPGLYAIAASTKPDFTEPGDRGLSFDMVVGDLVLVTRPQKGGYEVACLFGSTGAAAAGTEVALYRYNWQKGHQRVASAIAGGDGLVLFPNVAEREQTGYFLVARRGEDVAFDADALWFNREAKPGSIRATLVYSDRSIYRPSQTIRWKVVAYSGGGETSRFRTSPQAAVTLNLVDANNQTVESKTVTTNAFGSASGEFVIPAGRALGQWSLRSSLGGQAAVRVEEYKRPTFEVKLLDPKAALRLNREATLEGEARYYFGLPLTSGGVRWQVTRQPVYPSWWGLWYWRG